MLNIILYCPNDYRHSMCDGLRQAAKHHLSNHLVFLLLLFATIKKIDYICNVNELLYNCTYFYECGLGKLWD